MLHVRAGGIFVAVTSNLLYEYTLVCIVFVLAPHSRRRYFHERPKKGKSKLGSKIVS